MSLEENKAIVRRFFENGFNEGKLEIFDETVAADCPWGKDAQGPEAVKENRTINHAAFPDMHGTIKDIVAEGDKVAMNSMLSGTRTGEVDGWPPPKGQEVSFKVMWFFTLKEGKIAKVDTLQDSFAINVQLGYIPTGEEIWKQAGGKVE